VSPILGIWASQNYSRYSLPTSFESIATVTVGSGGGGSGGASGSAGIVIIEW